METRTRYVPMYMHIMRSFLHLANTGILYEFNMVMDVCICVTVSVKIVLIGT